jgi:hypothetical protein
VSSSKRCTRRLGVRTLFVTATALITTLGKALAEGELDERLKLLTSGSCCSATRLANCTQWMYPKRSFARWRPPQEFDANLGPAQLILRPLESTNNRGRGINPRPFNLQK